MCLRFSVYTLVYSFFCKDFLYPFLKLEAWDRLSTQRSWAKFGISVKVLQRIQASLDPCICDVFYLEDFIYFVEMCYSIRWILVSLMVNSAMTRFGDQ